MQGYKLYKKTWIYAAGNPLQERKLTNVSLRSLLNRGGIRNIYDFDCKEEA